jgi:hypothetical protein
VEEVDAGDGVERDGNVEVQVAGFGIVDAEAVDENEGLLEGGAADGEVGLNAFGGAGLDVEGRVGAEEIDGAVGADGEIAGEDDLDGAVAFGERERLDGGGDLDAVDFDEFGLRRGGIRLRCGSGRLCEGGVLICCAWGVLLADSGAGEEQTDGEVYEALLHGWDGEPLFAQNGFRAAAQVLSYVRASTATRDRRPGFMRDDWMRAFKVLVD